jgi:hypothetical protein
MRSIIITLLLLAAGGTICKAQCDQKMSAASSKTTHLDAGGAEKNTDEEQTTVVFDKANVTVSVDHDGNNQKMTGTVKNYACDWKVPFKEGKTMMSITLTNENGESRDFNVTIEGKEGKVTLLAESPQEPDDKIRLAIDKFEAVK